MQDVIFFVLRFILIILLMKLSREIYQFIKRLVKARKYKEEIKDTKWKPWKIKF